jgi:hypothetical protein
MLQLILVSVYRGLGVKAQRCVRCGGISRVAGVSQGGTDSVLRAGGAGLVGGCSGWRWSSIWGWLFGGRFVRLRVAVLGSSVGMRKEGGVPFLGVGLVVANYRVRSSGQDVPKLGFQVVGQKASYALLCLRFKKP